MYPIPSIVLIDVMCAEENILPRVYSAEASETIRKLCPRVRKILLRESRIVIRREKGEVPSEEVWYVRRIRLGSTLAALLEVAPVKVPDQSDVETDEEALPIKLRRISFKQASGVLKVQMPKFVTRFAVESEYDFSERAHIALARIGLEYKARLNGVRADEVIWMVDFPGF
jgi:hypothetical protein